jgi:superfamily II DNA or RNA helicase
MQNGLKDQVLRRLRQYVGQEKAYHRDGLMDHQVAALDRSLAFLSLPKGARYGIAYTDDGTGQEETGRKIDDFFEVISATGTGKTRMMGCLAKACDVPTLFLTPRNVINDQTRKEFCDEIGIDPADVGVYDSKQPNAAKARAIRQKYLITTYQSLPSLLRQYPFNDPGSEHYRPLVLLDEVHRGKGPQTARKIKAFLRKCIVAGFTATEAGEREALFEGQAPIFQLRIVPAIEKDLLCEGVRTGVIDVKIDEQWLKDFKPPDAGDDFREEDVARFVNSPAVIRGAIDFHFNEDPEHLARLDMGGPLHRLPTIFYTQGVDAARSGAELFNETAARLGKAARADYVSGEMSKTERDAKLRAFRTGELAALWNDSVLEMGFNDKNATVGYLLRPTRVTHRVEQPLGRFARKPTDDYAERYYPDGSRRGKVALAINVRATNMNPLLFGKVLGGRAAVYSQSRPQPSRPKQPAGGRPWPDGIEVHIDYDDVNEVVASAAKEREGLPVKTEEWLASNDTTRLPGGCRDAIKDAVAALVSAYDTTAGGLQSICFGGQSIRLQLVQSGVRQAVCICRADWPLVERAAGVDPGSELPMKDEQWLSPREIATLPGGKRNAIKQAVEALCEAYDAKTLGMQTVGYKAESIRVQKLQSGPAQPVCIYREDWPRVEKAAGVEQKKDLPVREVGWASVSQTSKFPGGRRPEILQAVATLAGLYDSERVGLQTVEYGGQLIRLQKMQVGGGQQSVCICLEDWPKVEITSGVARRSGLPNKDADWLAQYETSRMPGGKRKDVKAAMGAIIALYDSEALGVQTVRFAGQDIRVQQLRAFANQPVCILRDDWPSVVEAAISAAQHDNAPLHADERLKPPPISKKNLTPASEDLRRTGRSRDVDEGR